jgi:hypothetical protein
MPDGQHAIGRRQGVMSNPFYRAERCRDLANKCRAIAALCTHSTEIRAHYSRMAQHYSSLAEAEELGMLAYGPAFGPPSHLRRADGPNLSKPPAHVLTQ